MTANEYARKWIAKTGWKSAQEFSMSWNNAFDQHEMLRGRFPLDYFDSQWDLRLPRNAMFHCVVPTGEDAVDWISAFAAEVQSTLSEMDDSVEAASEYERGRAVGFRFGNGTSFDILGEPMQASARPAPDALARARKWYSRLGKPSWPWSHDSGVEFFASFWTEDYAVDKYAFLCGGSTLTLEWVEGFLAGWQSAESKPASTD